MSANQTNVHSLELKVGGWMVLGKRVAKSVKAIRLGRGLSQQDLANKTGLTVRYISRLENTAPNVTLEVIEKLTKGLGCSATDLFGIEDSQLMPGAKEMLDQMVHQGDCNTVFCPPEQIQVITHIKHVSLLKIKSFLQQKYLEERLTINQIAAVTMSSRSTVIKYLRAAGIPIRDEEHRMVHPSRRSWNFSFGVFSRAKWLILLSRPRIVENTYWRTNTCSPQQYPFSKLKLAKSSS